MCLKCCSSCGFSRKKRTSDYDTGYFRLTKFVFIDGCFQGTELVFDADQAKTIKESDEMSDANETVTRI